MIKKTYPHLTTKQLEDEFKATRHLAELSSFNSSSEGIRLSNEACFMEAELIRRKKAILTKDNKMRIISMPANEPIANGGEHGR